MSSSISLGGVAAAAAPARAWHSAQKSKSHPAAQRKRSSSEPLPCEQPSQPQPLAFGTFSTGCSCLARGGRGRPIMARILVPTPPLSVATRKANSGSSPEARAASLKRSPSGVIAASAARQASASPSQKATTVGSSFTMLTSCATVPTGFGCHGKSAPVGSPLMALRPSLLMTEPSLSRMTRLGMPSTPKWLLSTSFSLRCE
mmetsp:Transcript_43945/g.95999  ORF Transcript_43945/g.95999 Transcript_43945/m.95999 type:complete len:202 (-) Transcript_43945:52-657(-)